MAGCYSHIQDYSYHTLRNTHWSSTSFLEAWERESNTSYFTVAGVCLESFDTEDDDDDVSTDDDMSDDVGQVMWLWNQD